MDQLEWEEYEYCTLFLSCCEFHIPFKFLGVKVGHSPRRSHMWKEVINNVSNISSVWRNKCLYMGGKVVLINGVLNSILIYTLSFYKASIKVLKKIIWVEANFLWEGSDFKRIIHWVSWDSLCKPKEDGDLEKKNWDF